MPLIGITTHPIDSEDRAVLDLLIAQIVAGIERAGGLPVLIPLGLEQHTLRAMLARLDGLLLSGGGDIDPALYGALKTEHVSGIDAIRDQTEITLCKDALDTHKPLFGICRGTQLMNVALGGTLYRDISENPNADRHTFYPDLPHDLRAHAVQLAEDSLISTILKQPQIMVNSLHHQACRDVATPLRVVASSPDGMVEALEMPEHPFALSVQWHPEAMPNAAEAQALFEAFVQACAVRRG